MNGAVTQDAQSVTQELKPCPFCGGDNVKTFGPYGWYRQWGISHSCASFYSGTSEMMKGFHTEAAAVEAWNTRLASQPTSAEDAVSLAGRLEALAGDCDNTDGWQGASADVRQAAEIIRTVSRPTPDTQDAKVEAYDQMREIAEELGYPSILEALEAAPRANDTQTAAIGAEGLDTYDAGLLNDYGGGDVDWWQDYIRAELGRAHDFYADQFATLSQPVTAPQAEMACECEDHQPLHNGPCKVCGQPQPEGGTVVDACSLETALIANIANITGWLDDEVTTADLAQAILDALQPEKTK